MSQGGFGGISSIKYAGFRIKHASWSEKSEKNCKKMQKMRKNAQKLQKIARN